MPDLQTVGNKVAEVVPRWEWRVFGLELPLSQTELCGAISGPERQSTEWYLLSSASPHNVKLRKGAIEVKRLEEVHASGLERWRPTLRSAFPLDPRLLAEVWDALNVLPPRSAIPLDDEAEFLRALPRELRAVHLEKRRSPLILGDCPGEWVRLSVAGLDRQSLALEHPDPGFLLQTLRRLHLDPAANTNYPRALAQLVGGAAPAFISGA